RDRSCSRTIRPHRARQPPRCRARPYPGTLMSSLFDDLSLPDAFRRLDGVSVTPQTRDGSPTAPPGGQGPVGEPAPVEEPPPLDEPPYEQEPPHPPPSARALGPPAWRHSPTT